MNILYDSLIDMCSIGIIIYILEYGGRHPLYNQYMNSKYYVKLIKNKINFTLPDFFPIITKKIFFENM